MLLDTFLDDTPEVTQEHVLNLYKKDEWKVFLAKCTDGGNPPAHEPSGSTEEEFKALVRTLVAR
jgi:hypothetical protein